MTPERLIEIWNAEATPLGFAQVRRLSDNRRRHISAAFKELGDDEDSWRAAVRRYAKDSLRWPGRIDYGFDTFIRPSHRVKWFEAGESEIEDALHRAERFYLGDMRS